MKGSEAAAPIPEVEIPPSFPQPGDVAGKRVIITGASRGLGRLLAHAFSSAGAKVALASRTADDLQKVADELPGEHLVCPCDVQNEEQNEDLASRVIAEWGGLDVWVANAGISPTYRPIAKTSCEEWRRVLDVNLTGVFLAARSCARVMLPGGRIIVTSSVLAERPMAGLGSYCASKAALAGLVKVLALELAEQAITANIVAPGWFDSPMADSFKRDQTREMRILNHTALGRWGSNVDLAGAYLFLASSASSFITGSVLDVDGGYLLV